MRNKLGKPYAKRSFSLNHEAQVENEDPKSKLTQNINI
jgi:hypothetical protein